MRVFKVVSAHLVVIVLLLWLGLLLNEMIVHYADTYAGVITVFSVAFGVYTTALNLLYQRHPGFHFFVNRLWLKTIRTHTYWQPHFHFELDTDIDAQLLDRVWELLREGRHGRAVRRDSTPTTLSVSLDDLMVVKFRVTDGCVAVYFEQKLLVPSHLYDSYRQRLARLAEDIQGAIKPVSTRCGVQISFAEGTRNPYYGFFVNRVSPSLLQDFQVTFRLDANSDCRIEAATACVNIEASSFTDMFDALNQVLTLRALPEADVQ